jgi:hypothetical protein
LLGGIGTWTLVRVGRQSVQRHNSRACLLIEAHDGGVCPAKVSKHADAAAKADTVAHSKAALTTAAPRLIHHVCVGCSRHLGRGTRPADPFGRPYGIGTETVVSGVVTVAVVPVRVVTVTAVIGVMTVTVAATAAGNVGIDSVERGTAGTRSIEVDSGGGGGIAPVVDGWTEAGVASPPELCVDAGAALALERSVVLE